jgi:membrane fusion protein (multidrug efflux system)
MSPGTCGDGYDGSPPVQRFLAASLLLLLLAACSDKKQAQAPPPPPAVGVQPVATREVSRSAEFVGRIKALDTVQLRARVEGFLDKVAFTEGDDVTPGQLLYQIETVQYQAQLEQAKANRAAAAAAQLNAQLQYNRVAELVKRQNTSQATVDQDKANLDAASAGAMQAAAAVTYAAVSKVPDRAKLPTRHALTPTLT